MSRRTGLLLTLGAIVVAVAGFALYYFAPWTLFTNKTVNDAAPVIESTAPTPTGVASDTAAPAYPRVLARGEFIAQGHPASGQVLIVETAPGERILRIENLDTDNGPDVKVWLTDQPVSKEQQNIFDDGLVVSLGALKGNKGNQNYTIPADADLASLTSVSLWCDRFDVSFGAAALSPA